MKNISSNIFIAFFLLLKLVLYEFLLTFRWSIDVLSYEMYWTFHVT